MLFRSAVDEGATCTGENEPIVAGRRLGPIPTVLNEKLKENSLWHLESQRGVMTTEPGAYPGYRPLLKSHYPTTNTGFRELGLEGGRESESIYWTG